MKIGVIGLGLIGGSVALASTKAGHEVFGFDMNDEVVEKVLQAKAISEKKTVEELCSQCDIVVLCVPSRSASNLVETVLDGSAIVTDVSSVKTPICDVVSKLSQEKIDRFIGGHPMAGSEQSGFDASRENMFQNKMWIIVPPANNSLRHIDTIENFVSSLGAEHCVLSAEQHDKLVANISHLPQIASSVLMDLAADKAVNNEVILRLAGGGFRDMTRIAANNVGMWMDILHDNREEISKSLANYISGLNEFKDALESDNKEKINSLFKRAKSARSSMPDAARRLENLDEILIPVPDTPGVLAKITNLTEDINVYDIKIVHALEEDRGVLSLVVKPEDSGELVNRFEDAGFSVSVNQTVKNQGD